MAFAIGCAPFAIHSASAQPAVGVETLTQALESAYINNPTLNAQRAALRSTDEGVPQALSGFRPTVTGSADASITQTPGIYPRGMSPVSPERRVAVLEGYRNGEAYQSDYSRARATDVDAIPISDIP